MLKDAEKITYNQYIETKPQAESIPHLYALSKVHKNRENPHYRPIVDYTWSCMYRVAKALSEQINPVIGKSEYHLKNSKELLDKIKVHRGRGLDCI